MTERMVLAVASPHVDILGHCTGRKVTGFGADQSRDPARGPPSTPTSCSPPAPRFDTAVEINCRPERQDPPPELLDLALDAGCHISIDTDSHAPGQLEFLDYGCDKAADHGIDADRIINTWTADDLLAWTREHARPRSVVSPYVEEDRQAQDQRPAQEGQPRHQAERRPLRHHP